MKKKLFALAAASGTLAMLATPMAATSAQAVTSAPSVMIAPLAKAPKYKFKNCTALNKVYKHGVGKTNAKDKTRSKSSKPVKNFKKSTSLYKKVIGYNKGLDRDKDGVACEKH